VAVRTLHRFSFSGQEVVICMKPVLVFTIGDLVRQRSILATKSRGYGIVVAIMPENLKCLWSNGETRWLEPRQLYLIARGQNGQQS